MTRECSLDFEKIKLYVGNYTVSENLEYGEYVSSLKLMHKSYFSMISWSAELKNRKLCFLNENEACNDEIIFRFYETASDFGSSLFDWVNGNYKASKIMVRVGIENFVRAASALDEKKTVDGEKCFPNV